MARRRWIRILTFGFGFFLAGCLQNLVPEPTVPRMTKEELKSILGNPDVVILDVRLQDQWQISKEKIPGAVREDPEKDVRSWATKYPKDKTYVFYCT